MTYHGLGALRSFFSYSGSIAMKDCSRDDASSEELMEWSALQARGERACAEELLLSSACRASLFAWDRLSASQSC